MTLRFGVYFLLFLLWSCNQEENAPYSWVQFSSRDEGIPSERHLVYRAKVPTHWTIKHPDSTQSIHNTTIPNVEFFIDSIHMTVHTFPSSAIEERIPPEAQIERWKRQFDELDFATLSIEPRSLCGYTGLCFFAQGLFKQEEKTVMGYSMEVTPALWKNLSRQMASSYTIKAVGPNEMIAKRQKEIELFANSFELIEEIPFK